MLPNGSLFWRDNTTFYRMPGNNAAAPASYVVGTIPPPLNANDIPGGIYGVTARGDALAAAGRLDALRRAVYYLAHCERALSILAHLPM